MNTWKFLEFGKTVKSSRKYRRTFSNVQDSAEIWEIPCANTVKIFLNITLDNFSEDYSANDGMFFYKTCYTLFANRTNRKWNPFFAEQNIICENRANVLLYTVRCSPSIITSGRISFFQWKIPLCSLKRLLPRPKSCEQHTTKNLFTKHGEHLLYTIRCTSLFHHFVLVSLLFANSVLRS